jgi:hypothetical protein
MILQFGQHVKCIFRNGTIVEGIVEEWTTNSVHLRSLSDQSLLIILHPDEDIMLIKVMPEALVEEESMAEVPAVTHPIREKIRAKLKEVEQPMDDAELQNKTVAELRLLAIEQEKQILVNKIKEHFPGGSAGSKKSNYVSQAAIVLDRKPYGKS